MASKFIGDIQAEVLSVSGSSTFTGAIGNSTTNVPSVMIGVSTGNDPQIQLTGNGVNPHIDFSNTAGQDYDIRLINNALNQLELQGGNFKVGPAAINSNGVIQYGNGGTSVGALSYGTSLLTLEASSANTGVRIQASGTGDVQLSAGGAIRATVDSTGQVEIPGGPVVVGTPTNSEYVRAYHSDGAYVDHYGYGLVFARTASYIRPDTNGTRDMFFGTSSHHWNGIDIYANDIEIYNSNIQMLRTSTSPAFDITGHAGAANYNYLLRGLNDTGTKAVHFVNGSTRTTDGGANTYTIRNDGGRLRLGHASHQTEITGSSVAITDGNISIGSTSALAQLSLTTAGKNVPLSGAHGRTNYGDIHLEPTSATATYGNAITFGARDTSGVQAHIGTQSDGGFGTKMVFGTTSSYATGSQVKLVIDHAGNASFAANVTAAGDVTAYSDARLKSNIRTFDNALDTVAQLRGVKYDKDGKASTGVIAQEVEAVIPEVVHTADDEMGTKSVAYGNMMGVMIEAIKELKEIVAKQQAEIEELKNGK